LTLAEAAATVPDCSRLLRDSGKPAADCGVTSEPAPGCWSPQAVTIGSKYAQDLVLGAPAVQQRAARRPPANLHNTIGPASKLANSQQQQAAAAAEPVAEEGRLRIWERGRA
uniref:ELM2 domain-containing protein n=1 Tax=Macrostomum lignano TaxID=282301 RepID=A0A1I8FIN1_9PLAT